MAKKTSTQRSSGPYPLNIREEELKNKVAQDYFGDYDTTKIIGNIDFCIAKVTEKTKGEQKTFFEDLNEVQSLFWAEAKKGAKKDVFESLVQLILTIGKSRVYENRLPPLFLGAFDAEKIVFIPYHSIDGVFVQNDFNWNVTPSDHKTKEFQQVYRTVKIDLANNARLFHFGEDDTQLRKFIKANFKLGRTGVQSINITKNNFTTIYLKWLKHVKPTIDIDWDKAKKNGILDADFYLADLLSKDNESIKDSLNVLLHSDHYVMNRGVDEMGLKLTSSITFSDNQKAYREFWNVYNRPPRKEFWDYIVQRRDLLTPQDVRERKGSFFTPQQWVELSQQYLADVLGENWQDEYYIWDCAAGTGNLLAGLTNKYNIWASTLDQQDVDVMYDRIDNGANLLKKHVFQFDFLNDDFNSDKVPADLKNILSDPKKRKKLVIYINPPYAETMSYGTKSKAGLHVSKVNEKYKKELGQCANRELFAQFFMRIYKECGNCILAEFSKLKIFQAPHFETFRNVFLAKIKAAFLTPANSFDNVKGEFPIGFFIWDTSIKDSISSIIADVYNIKGDKIGKKHVYNYSNCKTINEWFITTRNRNENLQLGFMACLGNDFQQQKVNYILSKKEIMKSPRGSYVTDKNLIETGVYLAVRQCIDATWLNDRDQFLYPNDGWESDSEFQTDCLIYTLFHGQNRITSSQGVNHWIPFSEQEVDARDTFASHFMTDFLFGKITTESQDGGLFASAQKPKKVKLKYSSEAKAVLKAGRELWRYYHSTAAKSKYNVNASLYDIKEYFQGRNDKGKMNNSSSDERYNELIGKLRSALKDLAKQIEPKVYEYGFLRE